MLPINIEEVTPEHIASLVDNKVSERKVLEYKEKLPEGNDLAKKEFLGDVSSFANSFGGDIIYGIRDQRDRGKATGVPEAIVGLAGLNVSAEITRLESMMRDGIRPRIPNVQARDIEIPGKGSVVLLRVPRSWLRPHMVTHGGTSRFFARHNTGKDQLDVQEIGQLFAEQRSLGEELRNWRTERVARLISDEGPAPLEGPAKLLVHFVPAAALVGQDMAGWRPVPNEVRNLLRPSSPSGMSWRYNADGFLVYSVEGSSRCASYVQLFRNGSLEYADGYILNVGKSYGAGRETDIPSKSFEQKLVEIFGNALLAIRRLSIPDPVYLSCTLAGVQGLRLSREGVSFHLTSARHTFDRQIIQTPEVQIDRAESRPYRASLLPVVDSIWQASGYEQTPWKSDWGA
jgi:hypothetical protein